MRPHFADQTFHRTAVPTYYGGIMTFVWGSDDPAVRKIRIGNSSPYGKKELTK